MGFFDRVFRRRTLLCTLSARKVHHLAGDSRIKEVADREAVDVQTLAAVMGYFQEALGFSLFDSALLPEANLAKLLSKSAELTKRGLLIVEKKALDYQVFSTVDVDTLAAETGGA